MEPFTTLLSLCNTEKCATDYNLAVLNEVEQHLIETLLFYNKNQIVCIALQGSQNYGLQTPGSDIDTKLILTPSLNDLIFNRKPVSTTHIRDNNEHTDWKDIRLMFQVFRKQNLNAIEILFSPWIITNKNYLPEWHKLVDNRELVARYNPIAAIKTMHGMAMEEYHGMEHPFPSKLAILEKWGYDPKRLQHLCRVEEFMERYINGEKYQDCLHSNKASYLIDIKTGLYNLEEARVEANRALSHIEELCEYGKKYLREKPLQEAEDLLNEVQEKIMRKAIEKELNNNDR